MTTIVNTKIGQSRDVPRIWLEGYKLIRAGLKIGARYGLIKGEPDSDRLELKEVGEEFVGTAFCVSKRERNGVTTPLIEIRTKLLHTIFKNIERVKVAIRNGRIVVTSSFIETRIRERITRLMTKLRNKEKLAVCSLFHGGGVIDKALHSGLRRAGLSSFVQVGVEIDSDYLDASLRNNPEIWTEDSVAICSDIREINWTHNPLSADICIGGVPCTSSSKAGRAKNKNKIIEEHDAAGTLFLDFLNAIEATNPAIVEMENVIEYSSSAGMATIRSRLSSLGYVVYEEFLSGGDFGVLEDRRRMVMVAITRGLEIEYDFSKLRSVKQKEAMIQDVLEPIPLTSEMWKPYDYLATKEIRDKANGKNFARQLLTGLESSCGTIGRGYAKARSTEPFIKHPTDSKLSRLLTALEHARVKGIPAEVINGVSTTCAHEILGQSVVFPKLESVNALLGWLLYSLIDKQYSPEQYTGVVIPFTPKQSVSEETAPETESNIIQIAGKRKLNANPELQAMLF